MHIVIAIDSFKGSLSTTEAGHAAAKNLTDTAEQAARLLRSVRHNKE